MSLIKQVLVLPFAVGIFFYSFGQGVDPKLEKVDRLIDANYWVSARSVILDLLSSNASELSPTQKANLHNNLGYSYLRERNLDLALPELENALLIHKENPELDQADYCAILDNMGTLHMEYGNYDISRNYLNESMRIVTDLFGTTSFRYAHSLRNMAQLYEEVGYFDLAQKFFWDAHDILEITHDEQSSEYAEICNHMGRILIKNGKIGLAREYIDQSMAIYELLGDRYLIEYAESIEHLGMFYEHEGNLSEAEKNLLRALEIKKSIPNLPPTILLESLNDLGILYMDLGNIDRAEAYFIEVNNHFTNNPGEYNENYATSINNLAAIAQRKGDINRAKELFEQALAIYEEQFGTRHPLYSNTLNNLASVQRRLKNYSEAEKLYSQVLEIDRKIYGVDHPDYATTINNMGILYSSMGQKEKASSYYEESLKIRKHVYGVNHPTYAKSLNNLGLHYFSLGNLARAESLLKESIEIQINQIQTVFPILTERERELFYETIREDVEKYNFIATNLLSDNPGLIENIIDNQIKTKAILFSSTDKMRNSILESKDYDLIAEYVMWKRLKAKLANYYQIEQSKLERYNVDINALADSVSLMEKSLAVKSETFQNTLSDPQTGWRDIQGYLKSNEAIVEIIKVRKFRSETEGEAQIFGFTPESQYLAIIIKSDSETPEYVLLEDGVGLETRYFSRYRNALNYEKFDSQTYGNYWGEIDLKISGISRLYFAPDGVFYKINPNLFSPNDQSYLIDKYYTTIITNCKDIIEGNENYLAKSVRLFGNPQFDRTDPNNDIIPFLPGSEAEINEVSELLEGEAWRVNDYIGIDASELRVRSSYNPTILHIATHGFFSDDKNQLSGLLPSDNPLFKSGIYLSGAATTMALQGDQKFSNTENDGLLTAYEAMNLHLDYTELVVLSACETGLGDIRNGEGVYGLQRAFLIAGAKNLLLSMVKVDDNATKLLMSYFYDDYIKDLDAAKALRNAQNKLRKDYPNPYVWGSFILIGKG